MSDAPELTVWQIAQDSGLAAILGFAAEALRRAFRLGGKMTALEPGVAPPRPPVKPSRGPVPPKHATPVVDRRSGKRPWSATPKASAPAAASQHVPAASDQEWQDF